MANSVLFILLDKSEPEDIEMVQERYGPLVTHFSRNCSVFDVRTMYDALTALRENTWKAVIVLEPIVVGLKFKPLSDMLVSFVKDGGTLIFEGRFGRLLRPSDLNKYFRDVWNLSWTYGGALSEEWEYTYNPLYPTNQFLEYQGGLPRTCRFEGVLLGNVPMMDRVFVPKFPLITEKEQMGPHMSMGGITLPRGRDWHGLSPAVFSRYEKGYLGWVGEDRPIYRPWTIELLAAMCGI